MYTDFESPVTNAVWMLMNGRRMRTAVMRMDGALTLREVMPVPAILGYTGDGVNCTSKTLYFWLGTCTFLFTAEVHLAGTTMCIYIFYAKLRKMDVETKTATKMGSENNTERFCYMCFLFCQEIVYNIIPNLLEYILLCDVCAYLSTCLHRVHDCASCDTDFAHCVCYYSV